ncbi:MAG TPA: hypothetical protein PKE30_16800 [Niabella sp.]|nr:hypothetical protein [Niabella sp.]
MPTRAKNEEPYDYSSSHIVKEFYSDNTKKDLSGGMLDIFETIRKIAMNDLDKKKFIKFYYTDERRRNRTFLNANITYIGEKGSLNAKKEIADDKRIGFLYASFYKTDEPVYKKKVGKVPKYVAKAFHAVAHDYRQTDKSYKRHYLYNKYIEFYAWEIFMAEFKNQLVGMWRSVPQALIDRFIKGKSVPQIFVGVIKAKVDKTIKNLSNTNLMQIELLAENPTTYRDICMYAPEHITVPRKPEDETWLKKLSIKELINESVKLYNEYENKVKKRPHMLKKTTFSVNTSPKEWLKFFGTADVDKKFYLWQNFACPNYAFKVIIPLKPHVIFNTIIRLLRGPKKNPLVYTIFNEIESALSKFQKGSGSNNAGISALGNNNVGKINSRQLNQRIKGVIIEEIIIQAINKYLQPPK